MNQITQMRKNNNAQNSAPPNVFLIIHGLEFLADSNERKYQCIKSGATPSFKFAIICTQNESNYSNEQKY